MGDMVDIQYSYLTVGEYAQNILVVSAIAIGHVVCAGFFKGCSQPVRYSMRSARNVGHPVFCRGEVSLLWIGVRVPKNAELGRSKCNLKKDGLEPDYYAQCYNEDGIQWELGVVNVFKGQRLGG